MRKVRRSIFIKIFLAFALLSLIPLFIVTALISSSYLDMAGEIADDATQSVSPAAAYHILQQIGEVHQQAYMLMVFFLSITVILVIFAALYLTRSFANPIRALKEASANLARGDLDVRLEASRNDEFGSLAHSFNIMADQLSRARERMIEDQENLEQRIAERTAELELANVNLTTSATQIQEANRLRSEFLANISHELCTPLNAILGYTDLMLDGCYGALQDQQVEGLKKVRRNGQSLLRLIDDMLVLSKLESGRISISLEKFDPAELVLSVVEGVRSLFEKKNLRLDTEIASPLPVVETDRGKVQLVLYNLLSNALKFTQHGAVKVKLSASEDYQWVIFEVLDTGEGIAAQNLNQIFENFRQLDGSIRRRAGGTGLGLALSKKLIQLLDGTIGVQSDPGQGSTFRFSIPVELTPAIKLEKIASSPAAHLTPGQGKRLILAIDDDENVLKLLADILEPAGFEVLRCTDADYGVRQAKERHPFAVTLDIMMPHRNGWSVLKELKSTPETKDIPVMVVSVIDDYAQGYRLGVDAYMTKPINRRDLLEKLNALSRDRGAMH